MDINQWMIRHKYAKNDFNAMHIFSGLELAYEPRFWKRVHRVILYRDWRKYHRRQHVPRRGQRVRAL